MKAGNYTKILIVVGTLAGAGILSLFWGASIVTGIVGGSASGVVGLVIGLILDNREGSE